MGDILSAEAEVEQVASQLLRDNEYNIKAMTRNKICNRILTVLL